MLDDYLIRTRGVQAAPEWMKELRDHLPTQLLTGTTTVQTSAWPLPGGSPARRGLMAPVNPALVERLPWYHRASRARAPRWPRALDEDPAHPAELPSPQVVADGGRVYVRLPHSVRALSANDLSLVWQVPPAVESDGEYGHHHQFRPAGSNELPDASRDFFSDVVVTQGMVIALEGGDSLLGLADLAEQWLRRANAEPQILDRRTRLVALDARDGRKLWTAGRSADPEDPLGNVEFCAVPLAVEGNLWVPFCRNTALCVGVLKPKNGTLVREILLGSVGELIGMPRQAMRLTHAYGKVFVPSGRGVLFAVEADDFTLSWAARFANPPTDAAALAIADRSRWVPAPAVAVGGAIVVPPTECSELMAFSAVTGELRWTAEASRVSYIAAADDSFIWLGGRDISCLSVADGSCVWTTPLASTPTGRAAVAGDVVLVPTLAGLSFLDAAVGTVIRQQPLPGGAYPLGNLLSYDSALYSADASGVRRYPDLDAGFARACDRYEGDPNDPTAAAELVWLELFRGHPQRALDIAERIPPAAGTLTQGRVEALLAKADMEPASARDLLTRATEIARANTDRLRATVALTEHLASEGLYLEATRALWDVGLNADSKGLVPLGRYVRGSVHLAIARHLRAIEQRLTGSERRQIEDYVSEQIASAESVLGDSQGSRDAARRLRAIADLAASSTRQRALLSLARWRREQDRSEQAEQLLLEATLIHADPELSARARLELCDTYLDGLPQRPQATLDCMNELERQYGGMPLPEPGARAGERTLKTEQARTIADWVETARRRMPRNLPVATPWGPAPPQVVLTGAADWTLSTAAMVTKPRLVRFADGVSAAIEDRFVFMEARDRVQAIDADTKLTLWDAELRPPETFFETPSDEGAPSESERRAVADGEIAVFRRKEGLYAVGLITGRRLWFRPHYSTYTPPVPSGPDLTAAAHHGQLAAMLGPDHLALLRLTDGSTIWESNLRGEPVSHIRFSGDYVLALDDSLERASVFDRANGRLVQRIRFRQADPEVAPVRVIHAGGMLCGPRCNDNADRVAGVETSTGRTVWEIALEKPLVQIFHLQGELVGIAMLGGDVRIVEAATGNVVLATSVRGARMVTDAILFDGILVARHIRRVGAERRVGLVAIDIASGDSLWRRRDLVSDVGVNEALRLIGGVIPALVEYRDSLRARYPAKGLVMIDARTGENVGPGVELIAAETRATLTDDVHIRPGGILVGTSNTMFSLPMRSAEEPIIPSGEAE